VQYAAIISKVDEKRLVYGIIISIVVVLGGSRRLQYLRAAPHDVAGFFVRFLASEFGSLKLL